MAAASWRAFLLALSFCAAAWAALLVLGTTVCVFAPIVFTEGITRQLFVDMGLTILYTLGTEGKYSAYASDGSGIAVQGLTTMSQADQHNGGYGFGSLDTHYLYGTGYVTTSTGVKRTCYAIEQDFDKPMSPLYIEDAFLDFYSTQANPIPEGKELTMRFVELDDEGLFGETPSCVNAQVCPCSMQ